MSLKKNIKKIDTLSLFFHTALLIIFCLIVLPLHVDRMFKWLDGTFMYYLTLQQHQSMGFFAYGMNILEGLGDMSLPLLVNLIPASWFDLFLQPGLPYSTAVYTMLTVQYFISAYLLCRIFYFSKITSLSAAWVITLFLLPLLPTHNGMQPFYAITSISPYLVNFLFFCNLLVYLFFYIGKTRFVSTLLLSIAAFTTILYLLLVHAIGIIIVTPFFIFFFTTFILSAETKYEFFSKTLFCISSLLVLVYLRYFQFLFGLSLFSVPIFFPNNLTTHFSLSSISILFNSVYRAGNIIAGVGLLGMVGSLFLAHRKLKKTAKLILLFILILFLFGTCVLIFPTWYHGPSPLYFEYMLWPLYTAFGIMFLHYSIRLLKRLFSSKSFTLRTQIHNKFGLILLKNNTFLLFLFIVFSLIINFIYAGNEPKGRFQYPQKNPPPIIQYLIGHAALGKDNLFKGYTATFYPKNEKNSPSDWYKQIAFDSLVLLPNNHYTYRMVGLWFFNIPTLNKYSPIISPALFSLLHNTFSRSNDHQTRNVYLLTKVNVPLLQALGIKYIITNERIGLDNVKFIMSESIDKEHGSLYLYEILHTNIANFSPKQFSVLKNISKFISNINKNKVNFNNLVYNTSEIPYTLTPLINSKLYRIRDGIHLVAKSNGTSSILLPILYSHCLRFKFNNEKPKNFSIQRANLAETLLTFYKHIDVNITYRYSLMKYASCRLEDRNDLKKIMKI